MRIYLVRHAQPEEPDPTETDPDPPLTDDGREAATSLAQWMLDKDEVPNSILASPKLRTQETAEILRDAFGLPAIETKGSMGPDMSVRKMILKMAADKSRTRVAIVSHHESLEHGLRVLGMEPFVHLDIFAQAELRIMKVSRKDGTWKEHRRVLPSDLGGKDFY